MIADPADGVFTYEQVAAALPWSIRYAIEDRMPCLGGGDHHWDTEDEKFMRRVSKPADRYPRRECLRCHVTTANPLYRPEEDE